MFNEGVCLNCQLVESRVTERVFQLQRYNQAWKNGRVKCDYIKWESFRVGVTNLKVIHLYSLGNTEGK